MANTSCGVIDLYDKGGGSVLVEWGAFGGAAPDSYNVYLNGVLNQNVAVRQATITGLTVTSYSPAAIASTPNNSTRPQSMPPVGVVTAGPTYTIRVAAVKAGLETSVSPDRLITPQPTSLMLVTPMKRPWPFPNVRP